MELQTAVNFRDDFYRDELADRTWSASHNLVIESSTLSGNTATFSYSGTTGPNFMCLRDAYVLAEVTLLQEDGEKIPDGRLVAPVNGGIAAAVKGVSVTLNGTNVYSSADNSYAQAAYCATLLGEETSTDVLEQYCFYLDTGGEFNMAANIGFSMRRELFGKLNNANVFVYHEKPVAMIMRLVTDFLHTDKPMVSGVELRIAITFADPTFYLMDLSAATEERRARFLLNRVRVVVPVKTMVTGLYTDLERLMQDKPVRYPTRRHVIRKYNIPSGAQVFSKDVNIEAVHPDRLVVFIGGEAQDVGSYGQNPFMYTAEFKGVDANATAHITDLKLLKENGEAVQQASGVGPHEILAAAFRDLFVNFGATGAGPRTHNPPHICKKAFEGGCTFFTFDLTLSRRAWDYEARQPVGSGSLRLNITLDKVTPVNLVVYVRGEYHGHVEVTKGRTVTNNLLL